jgi:DNA (cytosine-5)-methyltransferase 1
MSTVTVHEAAKILDVSPDTIRRWEKKGLIKGARSVHNYRMFQIDELKRIKSKYTGDSSAAEFKVLKSKKTNHNVVELFSGCGGMALGFENSGLKAELLVEIDKDCVETLKLNRPHWNIIKNDIANIDFSEYRDKVEIVAGGFPCQAFSYAGQGRGFGDTRGTLFFEFARCVKEIHPKIALGENVRGLLNHDGGKTLATMMNTLDELGYNTHVELLRAQFLDVPQKRERIIIIGTRKDLDVKFVYPREKDYIVSLRA